MSDHAEARYQRDPQFKALVDFLHMQIARCELSPTEIREAAMLAAIHYAMTDGRL